MDVTYRRFAHVVRCGSCASFTQFSFSHIRSVGLPLSIPLFVCLLHSMISPLWWRFLQNLRQCFDAKQRWPYLGNALKYFVAAQVAMFGLFHPHYQRTTWWLTSFVVATLYQIWWDIFMDWGLLERRRWRPDGKQSWGLRQQRLYRNTWVYWTICAVNIVLRFCWTLSFIPPRYLDATGVLTETFGELTFITSPTIACAEIIRRTLWGLLRFEWEAIKHLPADFGQGAQRRKYHDVDAADAQPNNAIDSEVEMTAMLGPMKVMSSNQEKRNNDLFSQRLWTSDMSSMNDIQILGELCLYATIFALLGTLAAAHRGTL